MGKLTMTVGQALVKFLDNQYVSFDGKEEKFVDGIFTVFGHGIVCGLGQALDENPGELKVYQGRNEQGMAHAAAGFAKQSNRRKIIACASSIGPGAANMVTAVADATANNVPLLVFTGDTFSTRQPDPVLQQIEQFHDATITTSDAFRPVSRYWDRVSRPEQLMTALLNAMRVLTDPEKAGGVCISLPQDVQGETFAFPDYYFKKRVHRIVRMNPDSYEIKDAVDLIRTKKKPMVIVGGGVRYSEAGEEVVKFCETYKIPFGETQSGKSAIPSSHPLNLGGVGVTGNSAANSIAAEADLIIGVGTRLTDFTTGSKELFRNKEAQFVLVNVSRYHAEKLDAFPVVADAKAGIQAILAGLNNSGYHSAYTTEIEEANLGWKKEMEYLTKAVFDENYESFVKAKEPGIEEEFVKATGGVITQTGALGIIREQIEKDAIVVGSSGSLPGDLQRMWTTDAKDSYHMEYGYSCMGYEIAAALGAKIAEPDRACYAMVGDGAFMMLHSEIATALQENKKITVLLFDNCGFGCINNLQMGKGMGSLATMFRYRDSATNKQDGRLITTDFAMIGRGYGMTTFTAKTNDELITALKEAKETDNSVLIDIKVLPKSMTADYGSWWHVGIGDSNTNQNIKAAYEDRQKHLENARMY
ncbi:3D-(3,5/4)-trihydroxycyclohexane-1,2-dione acylhydrolase (decyclizing) [Anaerocolumna sedimenticola]|uniref:3D-(3,5/4)-trihydroxycyclohexane-1,2-dione acylhydrolase (Decyclizing) n=1 Tax=Anaerocolumna sedimenticola TaxID=2696063 RepID=A0A6P1TGW2_9FIRM|nr:3D-(3,5/4)-trihydroxycyclohexane-1,2-dione acylhydrolase (decyclizing) [Anaerocolumna sedimenticola]QHQ60460.1 3D-(3,5/4)-trihydroxycyclohexane-1,2-dione acylhydrolase (decyclizing) [Anaerocolumna sedimenticola]